MRIRFWGVRGSMPVPEIDKIKTGGHTTCVEVRINNQDLIILDAGTGIIPLGKVLEQEFSGQSFPKIHIFLSHTHWDHLYGFPFWKLNFILGTDIVLYGPKKQKRTLEEKIGIELDDDFCPIDPHALRAKIQFYDIEEGEIAISENIKVIASSHHHPGGAYGYRIEAEGKVFVFNTDVEHGKKLDLRVIELSRNADLMVHDAQYIEQELCHYEGWGHSSWQQAVEVAKVAQVKMLGLTHHDPERSDDDIDIIEKEAQKVFPNTFCCREVMTIDL